MPDLLLHQLEIPLNRSTPIKSTPTRLRGLLVIRQHPSESARDNVAKLSAREEVGKLFERSQRFFMEARDRPPSKEASA